MSETPTAETFHDAWVDYGMTCGGTHAVGEGLCQNVTAVLAALARSESPSPVGLNPWAEQLISAESENHCGDAGCQTRRTAAAVRVLTGWKEHQDYAWAVEAFEVEIGVRDPALVGPEPHNIPSRVESRPPIWVSEE